MIPLDAYADNDGEWRKRFASDNDRVFVPSDCYIDTLAAIGGPAQDSKEWPTPRGRIVIGQRARIFSFATVDLPSVDDGETTIGDECVLMHYAHVAHDCALGRKVTLCNAVQLAGHVRVHEGATLGLGALVHQHLTIGAYAMVGMGAVVTRDVPPFALVRGSPARVLGVNVVGMRRAGFTDEEIAAASVIIHQPIPPTIHAPVGTDRMRVLDAMYAEDSGRGK